MIKVIIPMVALLLVVFLKKLPGIGGNVKFALFLAGALTLLLNGIFDLEVWLDAFIDGLNRLAWIIALSIAGSLFAEVSNQIGAIDTIVGALNAKFGKRPRILVVCVIFALTVAGSLLGDAIAAATVIGVLSVGLLISMNLSGEKISAIIIMGAVTGSIMPPMTQALALGSSLVGADPDTVINMGYITITIVFAVVSIYVATFLVKKDNFLGANKSIEVKYADKSAGEILRKNWKSLLPMFFLILVIVLRTIPVPAISIDLGPAVLSQFQFISLSSGETQTLYEWLSNMTIINGITNGVVISILCALLFSFIFPKVRNNGKEIVREGFNKVKITVLLQVCCAFMLGCFYSAGLHRHRRGVLPGPESQRAEDRRSGSNDAHRYADWFSVHYAERCVLFLRSRSGRLRFEQRQCRSGGCPCCYRRAGAARRQHDWLCSRWNCRRSVGQEGGSHQGHAILPANGHCPDRHRNFLPVLIFRESGVFEYGKKAWHHYAGYKVPPCSRRCGQ